jgi:hypothetical protein
VNNVGLRVVCGHLDRVWLKFRGRCMAAENVSAVLCWTLQRVLEFELFRYARLHTVYKEEGLPCPVGDATLPNKRCRWVSRPPFVPPVPPVPPQQLLSPRPLQPCGVPHGIPPLPRASEGIFSVNVDGRFQELVVSGFVEEDCVEQAQTVPDETRPYPIFRNYEVGS